MKSDRNVSNLLVKLLIKCCQVRVNRATIYMDTDQKRPLNWQQQKGSFPFMANNTQVPKFAHLNYQVLHELEISINEYFLLDMIFHLSGNGSYWCNKKLENIAADMRLSVSGVRKLRDRLIEKKLLTKGIGNRLRTPEKVYKVYFLDESSLGKSALSASKSALSAQKSVQKVTKTPVENNRRLTIEKKDKSYPQAQAQNPNIENPGYASARQRYETMKRRLASKVAVR